jgi:hypothetical protein
MVVMIPTTRITKLGVNGSHSTMKVQCWWIFSPNMYEKKIKFHFNSFSSVDFRFLC